MSVSAILLAAGRGTRFGGDKTMISLRGRPLWHYAYATLRQHPMIAEVGIVVHPDNLERVQHLAYDAAFVVAGGETRTQSAQAGLAQVQGEVVLIHDAARPFLTADVVTRIVEAARNHPAVAPAIPVVDTIKQRREDGVVTLDRSALISMQTPQAISRKLLEKAYDEVEQEFTDEMAMLEAIGVQPHIVPGDPVNFKVTTPDDLLRAAGYLGAPEVRTGLGYDIHPFAADDRPMMLGGVPFDGPGLAGHSDADVLLHALTDAVLGAVGLGDIGVHFPNDDPRWRGAASTQFLAHVVALVREAGWEITNLDATLIAETPRIMMKADEIRSRLAGVCGLDRSRISVKATTNEKLGALGRSEGIAAFAVATVRQSP